MGKLNFKEIEITDISGKKKTVGDAREEFGNLIYTSCNGIAAHALALRIYGSDGPIDISEQEQELIVNLAQGVCTPAFIDGINKQLNKE